LVPRFPWQCHFEFYQQAKSFHTLRWIFLRWFYYSYYSYYSSFTHFFPLDFSEIPWSNFMKHCRNIICHLKLVTKVQKMQKQ
jgi:hypothetical protein